MGRRGSCRLPGRSPCRSLPGSARNVPSIRPTVGKFCTPEKPARLHLVAGRRFIRRNGSVPQTPASTGVSLDDGQHLAGHVHDDRVGVAVGHQPGQRAAAGHAEAAGVVDDDQVDAAGLGALGREAGAGAGADDRRRPRRPACAQRWRERLVARVTAPLGSARASRSAIAVGERRVVDVGVELDAPRRPAGRRPRAAPRTAPRRPRRRGTAGPSTSITETPPQRDEQRPSGPSAPLSLRAIRRPSSAHLLRASCASASPSGCARRGCGPRTASGTVSRGPKLTMSSAPSETTCGSAGAPAASSRSGPGRQDAADELVGQLGGGDVEHAGDEAAGRPAPPSPARRCRWRGRRAPRSRAPRAARARA